MRVLIADDDDFQRKLVAKFANEIWSNLELVIVNDGADALTQLCEQDFDLAILDNYMDFMNGSEVITKYLARCEVLGDESIKIILMTSDKQTMTEEAVRQSGIIFKNLLN